MHPVIAYNNGVALILYSYNEQKMLDSFNFTERTASKSDRLQKLVSLTQLMFASPQFEMFRDGVFKYAEDNKSTLRSDDWKVLSTLNKPYLFRLYCGFEVCAGQFP
jgi:hypothetical protein